MLGMPTKSEKVRHGSRGVPTNALRCGGSVDFMGIPSIFSLVLYSAPGLRVYARNRKEIASERGTTPAALVNWSGVSIRRPDWTMVGTIQIDKWGQWIEYIEKLFSG